MTIDLSGVSLGLVYDIHLVERAEKHLRALCSVVRSGGRQVRTCCALTMLSPTISNCPRGASVRVGCPGAAAVACVYAAPKKENTNATARVTLRLSNIPMSREYRLGAWHTRKPSRREQQTQAEETVGPPGPSALVE